MLRPLMAAAAAGLLVAGCTPALPTDPATSGDHPANPDAPTAAYPPPSQTLAIADTAMAEPLPPDRHDHAGPGDDDAMAPMPGMDHGAMGRDVAGLSAEPATAPTTQTAPIYTCPMHPEVAADTPGRCPICDMKLVEKQGGDQ